MKYTKEAIKYGIETLKVSPDEMFSLIESSKDYEGDDYKRWLASEIIKIAEKDGVGYSQLLVKKFNIISDLINTKDLVLKPFWVNKMNCENLWSVDFQEVGVAIEGVDWFNGLDFDRENSFFLAEELPELYGRLINGEEVNIIASLSDGSIKKDSELYSDAKNRCINCKNAGSLFLYRMAIMAISLELQDNFSLRVFSEADFWMDRENEEVIRYFLQCFEYKGYLVSSAELYEDAISNKDFIYLECTPRVSEHSKDCIELSRFRVVEDQLKAVGKVMRLSRSNISLLESLRSVDEDLVEEIGYDYQGNRIETVLNVPYNKTLGYLNIGDSYVGAWLSTLPSGGVDVSIPIIRSNINRVIIYYSVSFALKLLGINQDVKLPLTGNRGYKNLFSNCIPLFLFSTNTRFRAYKEKESPFRLGVEGYAKTLLQKSEVLFSFEAKDLTDFCMGYAEYLEEGIDEDVRSKCFNDLRSEAQHTTFNQMYIQKVRNLCDYIRGVCQEVI